MSNPNTPENEQQGARLQAKVTATVKALKQQRDEALDRSVQLSVDKEMLSIELQTVKSDNQRLVLALQKANQMASEIKIVSANLRAQLASLTPTVEDTQELAVDASDSDEGPEVDNNSDTEEFVEVAHKPNPEVLDRGEKPCPSN